MATNRKKKIKLGDLVIIQEEKQPTQAWTAGVVTKVHVGRDRLIRSAYVRMPNRNAIYRAAQRLHPLEITTSIESE